MMEFLLKLNKRGKSIIVITHDMHLMMEYAERTIVIGEGVVLADAAPEEVLTNGAVMAQASLRMTSIQQLAHRIGIPRPEEFVGRLHLS